MTVITTRVAVAEDGSVSLSQPVPAGEYLAHLKGASLSVMINGAEVPVFDNVPYPGGLAFDRADLHGPDLG